MIQLDRSPKEMPRRLVNEATPRKSS